MRTWWDSLPLLAQIFAAIAIPATLIMALQSILLLLGVGFGHDGEYGDHGDCDDCDAGDIDADGGLSLITIRGMVAFFSIGGWVGLACITGGVNHILAVIVAFAAGSAALVGIAMLFKYSLKLQDRGNLEIENALGKTGSVYIPVPSSRQGSGKVNVLFQQRLTELEALTDDPVSLKTGEMITVSDIIGEHTVLVSRAVPLGADDKALSEQNNEEERGGISKWIR